MVYDFLECEYLLEVGKCLENVKELFFVVDFYRKMNMVIFLFLINLL